MSYGNKIVIRLSAELETFINEKIEDGSYDSPSRVVQKGLQLLKEQDQLRQIRREELRREIQKGIDAMREGRFKTYNSAEEMMEDIIGEAKAEFKAKQKNGK